jgi:hypothetical protein
MEELDGYSMEDLQKNVNNLTSNGYRVVGMAMKEFARDECNWNEYGAPKDINEILKSGLTFLSLLGMEVYIIYIKKFSFFFFFIKSCQILNQLRMCQDFKKADRGGLISEKIMNMYTNHSWNINLAF